MFELSKLTGVASGRHRSALVHAFVVAFCLAAACICQGAKTKEAPAPCTSCHDEGQKLDKSAHTGMTCDTCHENHEKYPHPANIALPDCATCHQSEADDHAAGAHGQARKSGNMAAPACVSCHGSPHELLSPRSQEFRASVPHACGSCHVEIAKQFEGSVHGQALAHGITEAPLCTDCHGGHKILKVTNANSPVYRSNIRDTCGSCHGNVRLTRKFGMPADRLVSFDSSFHGLAAATGRQTVANCASCHGVHNILASSDPNSTINPKNLPKTCGQCHPGAGTRFAISQVHVVEGRSEPAGVRWVRQLYLLLIPLTLGLMLLHHGGDWVRKLIRARFRPAVLAGPLPTGEAARELRMLPFERVQHAALAISFFTLAWTGFALKFPGQFWSEPLLMMEETWPVRSWIHRIAAVIFMATALAHFMSLIANRNLRQHWKTMLPKLSDVRQGLAALTFNLGITSEQPVRSRHSYMEKVEYWAVVWGTGVMAATGVLLWATSLALTLVPKSWLDIATAVHFYEAVLATGAIVIWHFYSVIFDPDVYPLDTAFLTGIRTRKPSVPSESEEKTQETPVAGD